MTKFEQRCEKVADSIGVEVWFIDEPKTQSPFQDDGMVHICGAGKRAVFHVGQDCGAKAFNVVAKQIMEAMGKAVTDRVLEDVDMDDED